MEKAHLLPTVIGNISREGSNFYGRATLPFAVKESDKLYQGGNSIDFLLFGHFWAIF